MKIVVDASVAIKWFVPEVGDHLAAQILDLTADLIAPDLIVFEVTNVAWAKARRGEIGVREARWIAAQITCGQPNLVEPATLAAHALELAFRLRHPIFDCFYLACANEAGASLVTDDRRFIRATRSTDWEDVVIPLTDAGSRLAAQ